MKNILVTGGAGFIGSNFIFYFLKKFNDYNLINLDALTYAGNLENLKGIEDNPKYKFIKGDIRDLDFCKKVFKDYEIDSLINFAAESHVDRSILGSKVFLETNIMGTHSLLECAKEFKIERYLQVSTDEVYGSLGSEGSFTEESTIAPNSAYSASKASADLIVRSYYKTHNVPALITRCSNNYGPFQFPEKLIPLLINNCIQKKALPVYGKGENVRDWIHTDDHADAILTVFLNGQPGEIYNIGSDNEWMNLDLIKLICSILDEKLGEKSGTHEKLITFVKDRPGHDLRYAIDMSKISTKLKWKPKIKFQDGIRSTIDWYINNKDWIKSVTSGDYKKYYDKHYEKRESTF